MRFLPFPYRTAATAAMVLLLLLAWLIWGTLKYPESLWAPGDLSRFHAEAAACKDCHRPFQGASSEKCIACHNEKRFSEGSKPAVSAFHRKAIHEGAPCTDCHTEHRGALARITYGTMMNPHGEFVFRATGAGSCTDCHDFSAGPETDSFVLDNAVVRRLMEEGKGAHQRGKMADCLVCHGGPGIDDEED
jgi:hypothetical protein